MSKQHAENSLWGGFEDFVISGDLYSFTDHAGIKIPRGVATCPFNRQQKWS
jgi:hypothetical protein